MRKIVFAAMAVIVVSSVSAQEEPKSFNNALLPEAGDIGVGFDAMPFFDFIFSSIGGTATNPAFSGYAMGNNALWGKYFLDEQTAIRLQIRPGFGSVKRTNNVPDDALIFADPILNGNKVVVDHQKIKSSIFLIGGGLEKRRGKGRVQGFYGGELMIQYGSSRTTYQYGNAFSNNYVSSYTSDFENEVVVNGNSRVKEHNSGTSIGIGLRGFLGVEYFIAPKLSVAAEYGWGFSHINTGESVTILEVWSASLYGTNTTVSGTNSTTGVDTDISGAAIRVMFHF